MSSNNDVIVSSKRKYSNGSEMSKFYFNRDFEDRKMNKTSFRKLSEEFNSILKKNNSMNTLADLPENRRCEEHADLDNSNMIDCEHVNNNLIQNSNLSSSFADLIHQLNTMKDEIPDNCDEENNLDFATDDTSQIHLKNSSSDNLKNDVGYYHPKFADLDTVLVQEIELNGILDEIPPKNVNRQRSISLGTHTGYYPLKDRLQSKRASLSANDLVTYKFFEQLKESSVDEDHHFNDSFECDVDSKFDKDVEDELDYDFDQLDYEKVKRSKPFMNKRQKKSFIGKSISVDIINEDDGYFSSKSRRNGINLDSNSDDDDEFLTHLVEFKKRHKKSSGMRLAKSVENIFRLDKSNLGERVRSVSDVKEGKNNIEPKTTNFFKKHLFSKNSFDNCYEESAKNKPRRLSINLVEDSARKLSGISEMYLDEDGNVIRKMEIRKIIGQPLGFSIRSGNGIERIHDGVFVSRVNLGSFADVNNLFHTGDEIIEINQVQVKNLTLEEVVSIMQKSNNLLIETRSALPLPMHSRQISKSCFTSPNPHKLTSSHSLTYSNSINDAKPKNQLFFTTSAPTLKKNLIDKTKGSEFPNHEGDRSQPVMEKYFSQVKQDNESPRRRKKSKGDEKKNSTEKLTSSKHSMMKSPLMFLKNTDATKKSSSKSLLIPSVKWFSKTIDESKLSSSPPLATVNSADDIRIYESDLEDSLKRKTFTGNLAINIHKLDSTSRTNESLYINVEIDGESKAVTSKVQTSTHIEESFDVEVNQASSLTFQILSCDTIPIGNGRISLGKLLAFDTQAEILLKTFTCNHSLKLTIDFTNVDNFLKRTPSKRTKGVFGFNIAQTLLDDGNTIPLIVRKCVDEIENRGLTLQGIYRISGNARKKKLLHVSFDEDCYDVDIGADTEFDCHVISGVLKDYLRELPQPLISQELYLSIYKTSQSEECNISNEGTLLNVMKSVHYSNRATLIYIIEHLIKVSDHKEDNKMDFKNLAVCFGPVLMCPPTTETGMFDFKKQVVALEFLLTIWPKSSQENTL